LAPPAFETNRGRHFEAWLLTSIDFLFDSGLTVSGKDTALLANLPIRFGTPQRTCGQIPS